MRFKPETDKQRVWRLMTPGERWLAHFQKHNALIKSLDMHKVCANLSPAQRASILRQCQEFADFWSECRREAEALNQSQDR
jgi:hypothetical protein